MRPIRPVLTSVLGLLALGLASGCSQPSSDFSRDDPAGYTACRDVTASRQVDDDTEREELLATAAAAAAASQTGEIRDTVSPPVDPDALEQVGQEDIGTYTVDEDALVEACEDVGFEPDDVDLEES